MTGVPIDDRGLLLGDGLFETVLARDGALVLFDAHARRLQAGARTLGLPAPAEGALRALALQALGDAGLSSSRAAVRLTLTAGSGGRGLDRPDDPVPRLIASAAPAAAAAGPLSLTVAAVRRNDTSPAARLKTLAYLDNLIARRQARAAGADDALLLNTRGHLACAAVANLFWAAQGRLFTPALSCGVLDGIMRGQVLAAAAAAGMDPAEVCAGAEVLEAADAVFVTSSLVGVRAVDRVGVWTYAPSRAVEHLAAAVAGVS